MKKTKRVFSFLLAFLTILSLSVNGIILCVSAEGSETTPTITANTDWFVPASTEQHIKSASDLLGLLSLCTSAANGEKNSSGKTFYLDNDIDLGGMEWTGIVDFYGNFDGQGHTVSNFWQDNTTTTTGREKNGGFFRNISTADGYVKNLCLIPAASGAETSAEHSIKLSVKVANTTASVGALVGNVNGSKFLIENIYVKANVEIVRIGNTTGNQRIGGVVGLYAGASGGTLTMNNVVFDGTVSVNTSLSWRIGMLIGGCHTGSMAKGGDIVMSNCLNYGSYANLVSYADNQNKFFDTFCGAVNGNAAGVSGNANLGDGTFVNCVDSTENGAPIRLDEAYLAEHTDLLTGWTTSETCGILPVGVARMLEKPDVVVQRSLKTDGEQTYSVRVLGLVDTLVWDSLSFEIDLYINGSAEAKRVEKIDPQTRVYTSVFESAGEKTNEVTANELGGNYIYGITLTGIPAADTVVKVVIRPVKTLNNVDYVSDAAYEVTYENGVLKVA